MLIIIEVNAGLNAGGEQLVENIEGKPCDSIRAISTSNILITWEYLLPSGQKVRELLQDIREMSPCCGQTSK